VPHGGAGGALRRPGWRAGALRDLRFLRSGDGLAQTERALNEQERTAFERIAAELKRRGERATGRLYTDLFADQSIDRDTFEQLLGGMARAGLVELVDSSFEKDGKRVPYTKARPTPGARALAELPEISIRQQIERVARKRKKKAAAAKPGPSKESRKRPARAAEPGLSEALRAWRLGEAKRRRVPAFHILSDRALEAIAAQRPGSTAELLAVPGVGLKIVEKYGARIFEILAKGR